MWQSTATPTSERSHSSSSALLVLQRARCFFSALALAQMLLLLLLRGNQEPFPHRADAAAATTTITAQHTFHCSNTQRHLLLISHQQADATMNAMDRMLAEAATRCWSEAPRAWARQNPGVSVSPSVVRAIQARLPTKQQLMQELFASN